MCCPQIFDEYDDEVTAAEEAEQQGHKPDQAKVSRNRQHAAGMQDMVPHVCSRVAQLLGLTAYPTLDAASLWYWLHLPCCSRVLRLAAWRQRVAAAGAHLFWLYSTDVSVIVQGGNVLEVALAHYLRNACPCLSNNRTSNPRTANTRGRAMLRLVAEGRRTTVMMMTTSCACGTCASALPQLWTCCLIILETSTCCRCCCRSCSSDSQTRTGRCAI